MQLYYFLVVLISLSFGSVPGSSQSVAHAAIFSSAVVIGWWVLCLLATRLVYRSVEGGEMSEDMGYRVFQTQMECFRWFSIGLILLCLGGFGLGRNLSSIPIVEDWLILQSTLLLSPGLAMMFGIWFAEYRFARRFDWIAPGPKAMLSTLSTAMRANVGWLLIPMGAVMLVIDLASRAPVPGILPGWCMWISLAVLAVVSLPWLVRRVFPTIPIDEDVESWIHTLVTSTGLRPLKIIQWDTKHRIHNAMVAGLFGRFRVLLVSDRLLEDLSRSELAMVILHEAAHVKRFHVAIRVGALIPAWLLGAAVDRMAGSSQSMEWLQQWSGALGAIASLLATVLILRWISYRSEYDADSVACDLAVKVASSCPDVPSERDQAANALATALLKVTEGCDAARKPTWLHPGIADRIAKLNPRCSVTESDSFNGLPSRSETTLQTGGHV